MILALVCIIVNLGPGQELSAVYFHYDPDSSQKIYAPATNSSTFYEKKTKAQI